MKTVCAMLIGGLVLSSMLLGSRVRRAEQQLEDQSPIIARHKQLCDSVHAVLYLARRNLRNPDRKWSRATYAEATRYDWAEARMCSDVTVGDSCEPDDQSCMLHALDWALVNIR